MYNYFAYKEHLYIENAKGLSFYLLIFFPTSVGCIVLLVLRRLIIGAELGGQNFKGVKFSTIHSHNVFMILYIYIYIKRVVVRTANFVFLYFYYF